MSELKHNEQLQRPSNFQAIQCTDTEVTLTWTPLPQSKNGATLSYEISDNKQVIFKTSNTSVGQTKITINMTQEYMYHFYLRAIDHQTGQCSKVADLMIEHEENTQNVRDWSYFDKSIQDLVWYHRNL